MSNNIVRAIKAINPDAEFSFFGEDLDTIQWSKGTTPISKTDIEAKIAELPTEEEEKIARKTDATSGEQKLKDLGLTDAEIKPLTTAA